MRAMVLGALTMIVFGGSQSFADTDTAYCRGSDVIHVTRPFFPSDPGRGTFSYSFRQIQKAAPGSPTIIFLPGGPADESMMADNSHHDQIARIPSDFGLILTDPRGVGCNKIEGTFPKSAYVTEYLASDVVEIVRTLGLKRYYLHGLSYGTQLATVTASMAESSGLPKSEAVILEGIVGRAFRPMELYQGFLERWPAMLLRLDPAANQAIRQTSPLNVSGDAWGSALAQLLVDAKDPSGIDTTLQGLSYLDPVTALQLQESFKKTIEDTAASSYAPIPQEVEDQYEAIMCHEDSSDALNFNTDTMFTLKSGQLVPILSQTCKGIPLDHPFDAHDWPTTSPVYYFEGEFDPSTPMFQARYHFDSQANARRTFVTVKGAGHHALWALQGCEISIWKSIAARGVDLDQALKSCSFKTETVRK